MPEVVRISATVNGEAIERDVKARQSLADFLRDELNLTGTHLGCEHGVCGACSVVIDGDVVRSCLTLAAQVNGKTIETVEGLSDRGALDALHKAFLHHNAAQCGFCTPGMLVIAHDMIARGEAGNREEIRDYISGNFCRCTGYQAIVSAIESVARQEEKGAA